MDMNRLIFATGTWQIVLAASALRQETIPEGILSEDYLVLSASKLSDEMKQIMMQIASSVWNWQKIIWADDILDSSVPVFTDINFSPFLQNFKKRIGIDNFGEIWLCKLIDQAEKIVAESYPDAAIAVYEDGLHTYVPQEDWQLWDASLISQPKKLARKISCRVKEAKTSFNCLNKGGLCHKHIARISKAYCLNCDRLPLPRYLKPHQQKIESQSIIDTLDIINKAIAPLSSISQGKNYFLILGQCFSRWNLISWSDELKIYRQIFKTITELNLVPIWKEHPRADRAFFPHLAENCPLEPIELNVHYAWPIELFARQLNLQGCVSVTSTSLFNLKSLFEIPTYTVANELSTIFKGDFAEMTTLVANNIPPLSSINISNTNNTLNTIN